MKYRSFGQLDWIPDSVKMTLGWNIPELGSVFNVTLLISSTVPLGLPMLPSLNIRTKSGRIVPSLSGKTSRVRVVANAHIGLEPRVGKVEGWIILEQLLKAVSGFTSVGKSTLIDI